MLRTKTQIAKICNTQSTKIGAAINVLKLEPLLKRYYNENQMHRIIDLVKPKYLTFESKINNK